MGQDMKPSKENLQTAGHSQGDDRLILAVVRLILAVVLAVVTFWLFAQTTLNVAPVMQNDLRITDSMSNIAVSITALFSGIFIVVAGGLADRLGRVKLTNIGLLLSILGSLLIALSPVGTVLFLMAGRIIQGISAACIMPATLALVKAYFDGQERQRAISFWSIGSWGGSGLSPLFGGFVDSTVGWRWIFWMSIAVALASLLLLRSTPESKTAATVQNTFDWPGLIAFIAAMVALNIVVGQGAALGLLSPTIWILVAVFLVSIVLFFKIEIGSTHGFVDLMLFDNKTFSGATLSNFLLNGAAGTLIVVLTLVQRLEAGKWLPFVDLVCRRTPCRPLAPRRSRLLAGPWSTLSRDDGGFCCCAGLWRLCSGSSLSPGLGLRW
jgi:MFS transporter, DHA2 family, multidrug resistance protein